MSASPADTVKAGGRKPPALDVLGHVLRSVGLGLFGGLLAVVLLLPLSALASFPASYHDVVSCKYSTSWGPTVEGDPVYACTVAMGAFKPAGYTISSITCSSATACKVTGTTNTGAAWSANLTAYTFSTSYCPADSSIDGEVCTCNPGFTDDGSSCSGASSVSEVPNPFSLDLESAVAIGGATLMLLTVAFVLRILRKALESSYESESQND